MDKNSSILQLIPKSYTFFVDNITLLSNKVNVCISILLLAFDYLALIHKVMHSTVYKYIKRRIKIIFSNNLSVFYYYYLTSAFAWRIIADFNINGAIIVVKMITIITLE